MLFGLRLLGKKKRVIEQVRLNFAIPLIEDTLINHLTAFFFQA